MATQELDQLGAADFAIVEFPEGRQCFSGFFLLSLLFFPLSLILAYMADDRTANRMLT